MNYLQWNNALIDYFFRTENEEKEIFFYFNENIINEVGSACFPEPENGYNSDFFEALRLGLPGFNNHDFILRIIELEVKSKTTSQIDRTPFRYPPYFAYLITFILPFTSGEVDEDLNANNFYDNVKNFFEKHRLTSDFFREIKNKLSKIDYIWKELNKWLVEEQNFSVGYIEEHNPPTNRKYVQKFLYHVLFRKDQEERLSKIFDENNILPEGILSKEKLKELLIANKEFLKLSRDTINLLKVEGDDTGEKIINRILRYYYEWDGTVYSVEKNRGYSRGRLSLCLNFNRLSRQIDIEYFRIYSKKGIPEGSVLSFKNGMKIDSIVQISNYYSSPINNCFQNLKTSIELLDEANRIKYSWIPGPFFMFKKVPNYGWIEIHELEYNVGKTLIICQDHFFEAHFQKWFVEIEGGKQLFNNNDKTKLPKGWLAFSIDQITKFRHPYLLAKDPDLLKPKINFDRSFYSAGSFFKHVPPLVWVENIETNETIIARYNKRELPLVRLDEKGTDQESESLHLFEFTEEHINSEDEFKLICGNIESHLYFTFKPFSKTNNELIESYLPKRNPVGNFIHQGENYIKGIEPFFSKRRIQNLIPRQRLLNQIFYNIKSAKNYSKNLIFDFNHPGNILLHYISNKGKLTKKEFDSCVFKLLERLSFVGDIKKKANYIRYQLQDSGFIDYNPNKSLIIVNKPHLIIRPSPRGLVTFLVGARDPAYVHNIFEYCEYRKISAEVQQEEDPLFPQEIFIKFREIDEKEVCDLANKFDITYKKGGLFTQFALISYLRSIDDWKKYILPIKDEIPDFEGGHLFSIELLEFIQKPDNFDKNLALTRFSEINGYRTLFRLWYRNVAYNIPDQQFGIYLFLYLYKSIHVKKRNQFFGSMEETNFLTESESDKLHLEFANIIIYDKNRKYLVVSQFEKVG